MAAVATSLVAALAAAVATLAGTTATAAAAPALPLAVSAATAMAAAALVATLPSAAVAALELAALAALALAAARLLPPAPTAKGRQGAKWSCRLLALASQLPPLPPQRLWAPRQQALAPALGPRNLYQLRTSQRSPVLECRWPQTASSLSVSRSALLPSYAPTSNVNSAMAPRAVYSGCWPKWNLSRLPMLFYAFLECREQSMPAERFRRWRQRLNLPGLMPS
jgi:hypothetical protein